MSDDGRIQKDRKFNLAGEERAVPGNRRRLFTCCMLSIEY